MTPIKTVILNNTNRAQSISYAGKNLVWLPANGTATVDFDIWSVANDIQREAIKYVCAKKDVELTLMVLGNDGQYMSVSYNPAAGAEMNVVKSVQAPKKSTNEVKIMVEDKDHIVKVGGEDTKKSLEALGAKAIGFDDEILPVREVKNGVPEEKEEEAEKIEGTVIANDSNMQSLGGADTEGKPTKKRTKSGKTA